MPSARARPGSASLRSFGLNPSDPYRASQGYRPSARPAPDRAGPIDFSRILDRVLGRSPGSRGKPLQKAGGRSPPAGHILIK